MKVPEEAVTISDPGEVGKGEHNWGDRASVQVSNIFAWVFPVLMIAICLQVVLRSSGMNQAWLDDLQWWLYGAASLIAIGYAVTTNSHVRVDIFYDHYSNQRKYRIEIFALAWLFLPFIILSWDTTLPYAIQSYRSGENSDSPNGLHNLWILKLFMNVAFVFIGAVTWSAYVRFLSKYTRPLLWKQFLYAFPSTTYILNLIIYYSLWWYMRLTTPAEVSDREIGRSEIFGTFNIGPEEMKYTVAFSFVAVFLLIVIVRLLSRNSSTVDSNTSS